MKGYKRRLDLAGIKIGDRNTGQQKISKHIKERKKWGKAQMQDKGETYSKCLMYV